SCSSERVSMARPPSVGATLHPRFGATGEAPPAAIAARSTFFDERVRDGFSGRLWTAGAGFIRGCRHAATAHAKSCQAEIANEHTRLSSRRTPANQSKQAAEHRS